jgi:hypothetical protein
MTKILHVVHCIDTEGPLTEDLEATFERLEDIFNIHLEPTKENLIKIQEGKIDSEYKSSIAKTFSKEILSYNENWSDIDKMLDECMSEKFRLKNPDDFGGGWVYSWHCMDHAGYSENPRRKDTGYGNVFRFYKAKINNTESMSDELNWHFHPLSFFKNPLQAATSYNNSMETLLNVLCRRVIDEHWFPTVNRPGFHSERPDSHAFLEQWIPFDFANQSYDFDDGQNDLINGRFGDWRRASKSWTGYNPSHRDYQVEGLCNRKIFRCLNVGTRFNNLTVEHVKEAFIDAQISGQSVLAFADHDYRDIRPDILYVQELLSKVKDNFPDVKIKYSGANYAAALFNNAEEKLKLISKIKDDQLIVEVVSGALFGPQPFLAIKTKCGQYFHDNFDVIVPDKKFSYCFDSHTLSLDSVSVIGVASAGVSGNYDVNILEIR